MHSEKKVPSTLLTHKFQAHGIGLVQGIGTQIFVKEMIVHFTLLPSIFIMFVKPLNILL